MNLHYPHSFLLKATGDNLQCLYDPNLFLGRLSRVLFVVISALLIDHIVAAEETSPKKNNRPTSESSDNKGTDIHPWIATSPPAYARLIDAGRVRIEVDEATVKSANKTALTIFSFKDHYNLRYRLIPTGFAESGANQFKLITHFIKPETTIFHRILLRESFQPVNPWETRLLQHEFDHVAISTDPRLIKLIAMVEWSSQSWSIELENKPDPTPDDISAVVEERLAERRKALKSIVNSYYQQLDKISNHGMDDIQNRKDFFMKLYSLEDLREQQFPYVQEIAKKWKPVFSKDLIQHYRLPDEPDKQ